MTRKRARRSVSLPAAVIRDLRERAAARGLTPTRLVDLACADLSDPTLVTRLRPPVETVEPMRMGPRPGPRLRREIVVDSGTASMLDDLVERAREQGRETTASEVLEEGIGRFLDIYEGKPYTGYVR